MTPRALFRYSAGLLVGPERTAIEYFHMLWPFDCLWLWSSNIWQKHVLRIVGLCDTISRRLQHLEIVGKHY
jgi:hypothetical protein